MINSMDAVRREVVVTGTGAVSPYGVGVGALWNGVRNGESAIDWIECMPDLDPMIYPVRYAGEVKGFSADKCLKRHCEVRNEKSVQLGIVAGQEALRQARLLNDEDRLIDPELEIATLAGTGQGACHECEIGYESFFRQGPAKLRPTTAPKCMFNSLSSNLSIYFGLKGTNHVIASACSSASAAIGLAAVLIRHGFADIVLAGGADAPLTHVVYTCWTQLRVLAKHPEPKKACRPFDRQRNGMLIGEGAGMLVLESRQSAEARGAPILARIAGYGASSDAFHVTAPTLEGQVRAMRACLQDAGLELHEVDYINMHGTGTKANDETEAHAVVEVFGARGADMPVSSSKSMLGHALGAAGAIEFLICMQAIRTGFVPPTLNCDEPDPDVGLDYVPNVGRPHNIRFALSNSFAFGGNNTCLLVGAAQ
jgi:3-oxoacyl-[acyl-carrier-protein] synthase II